ncbi:MAG TPA: SIMPL domain-containing protein [Allosphingosinicella sp.]|nr:SIMPL domain-containing protein [Allosphingosinicella sp.]
MRLVILGLSLALAGSAPLTFAVAQSPVTTQPLAAGEVLVEINAMGSISTRADSASLSASLSGSGDTEAAARTATEAQARELRTMLRAFGIADADIRVRPITTGTSPAPAPAEMGYGDMNAVTADMNMAMTMDEGNTAYAMEDVPPPPAAYGQTTVEIVVRNMDRVPAVQRALMERGVFSLGFRGTTYALADSGAARRAARAQAMQQARADAESYAAALNMRVVRIVRITERIGLDGLSLFVSEASSMTRLFASQVFSGPEVLTMAVVGVDFALAPR